MLETNGDNSFNVPHERDIHEDDNTLLLPLEQQLVCPEHEQPDTDEAHVHQAQTPQEQEVDEQADHEQCHVTSREAEVEPAAASTVLASLDLFTLEQQHSGIDANELLIDTTFDTETVVVETMQEQEAIVAQEGHRSEASIKLIGGEVCLCPAASPRLKMQHHQVFTS